MNDIGKEISKDAFYDRRIVLLPDVAQLRSGDILLTRTTALFGPINGIQSKKIRVGTGGDFSHALICSKPPVMIEAIGTGVSTLSLARCYAHGWENIRVLRHPDAALAEAAASAVQLQVGRDYSVRRALRAAFPSLVAERIADFGTFCSALVAQSYVGVGDTLFARVPVERTTPATIEKISELTDVTRHIFYEGVAPQNIDELVPLDAHSDPSPSARQTKISGRYAKLVMDDAELVLAAVDTLEIIPTHYGVLSLIMVGMDAVGAHTGGGSLAADVTRLDQRLADLISSGELADVHADLEAMEGDELQQAVRVSFDLVPDIDPRAMRGQLETTKQMLEARRTAVTKLEAWNEAGRSSAVAAYTALERNVITSMERRQAVFQEVLARIA